MRTLALGLAGALVAALLVAGCGDQGVVVTPEQLPAARVGQPFEATLSATRGGQHVAALGASITKGSLPAGIAIVQPPGNGTGTPMLQGTPTAEGTYTFTVELAGFCTMGGCIHGARDYTLVVSP